MRRADTITKSLRLTPEQVAFVEAQPGDNFTDKLIGILEEYRRGEKKRKEEIAYYDTLLLKRRKELWTYNDLQTVLASLRRNACSLERQFFTIMESLKQDSPEEGKEKDL